MPFMLLASSMLHADDRTNDQAMEIFATAWGETLAQNGSGFYNEIAADVLANVDGHEVYKIMPYRRAKQHFFKSGGACLYPSSLPGLAGAGQITDTENYIESDGIFSAKTHLFVRAGMKPPGLMDDISGKIIAYANGSVAASVLLGHGASLIGVNSEQDKAQMLISGRVDMISGMMPDTGIVFAKLGGKMPVFAPSLVLYEVSVSFVCRRSPETEQFVAAVNRALGVLSNDASYSARLLAAARAQDTLTRAGDGNVETGKAIGKVRPAPSGERKPRQKSRNRRRLPRHNNE